MTIFILPIRVMVVEEDEEISKSLITINDRFGAYRGDIFV